MLARKALAGTAGAPKVYVEDVFSTYLYTGNASTQTITNNIDISGKGGLVWTKSRSNVTGHILFDTERGLGTSGNRPDLHTELTSAQVISGEGISSFNSDGYTLENTVSSNGSGRTLASWTFRKAKKFFDVVTYTGNGSNRTISHNLGSVPGSIFIKRTDTTGAWAVYHRSLDNTEYLVLNTTAAKATGTTYWNSTTPTSTEFSLGTATDVNANSGTYVAYIFAHDAGGFGDAGSDNVISCGSFTTNGSGYFDVNLGYEPQWLLFKKSSGTGDWFLADNMRGMGVQALAPPMISANTSAAETTVNGSFFYINSTGFGKSNNADLGANSTYIYIAIRRGPMKTPTSGTSVFTPVSTSGDVSEITAGFPVDLALGKEVKNSTSYGNYAIDRLRGGGRLLQTNTTGSDITSQTFKFDSNTKFLQSGGGLFYGPSIYWLMRRAPGFFDQVCYTGTGSGTNSQSHNLGVTPEMLIFKSRSSIDNWAVFFPVQDTFTRLNSTSGKLNGSSLPSAATSTTFDVGSTTGYSSVANVNSSNDYVAYLFASLSGISKVGSYTGNGSNQTINCNFTAGARFILIKRTDSSGDWYVWDTARGIVSGNDPRLSLNTTAAEVTTDDSIDPDNSGFIVNQLSATNINVNAATYIYLAIA